MPRLRTIPDRLATYSTWQGKCLVWTGFILPNGYGLVSVGAGKHGYAHRVSYEYHVAPIPEGLVLDHLCRNRACILSGHLEAVTVAENNARGAGAWKLTGKCNKGLHDVTDPSAWAGNGVGKFTCKACRKDTRDREAVG